MPPTTRTFQGPRRSVRLNFQSVLECGPHIVGHLMPTQVQQIVHHGMQTAYGSIRSRHKTRPLYKHLLAPVLVTAHQTLTALMPHLHQHLGKALRRDRQWGHHPGQQGGQDDGDRGDECDALVGGREPGGGAGAQVADGGGEGQHQQGRLHLKMDIKVEKLRSWEVGKLGSWEVGRSRLGSWCRVREQCSGRSKVEVRMCSKGCAILWSGAESYTAAQVPRWLLRISSVCCDRLESGILRR